MSKIPSIKIPIDFEDLQEPKMKYRLIRINDGRIMYGKVAKWITWGEDEKASAMDDEPAVGKSLVLDPMSYGNFGWMTTVVTEITKQQDGFIKFKTQNSTYELHPILDSSVRKTSFSS